MNLFEQHQKVVSNINEHMEILKQYASQVNHVTEIGVGCDANSTISFIAGKPEKLISYDIVDYPIRNEVKEWAKNNGVDWEYRIEDSLNSIEETDFLFIDGEHTYYRVKLELYAHESKVKRFIGFHDVVSFASRNEDPGKTGKNFVEGIVPAIFEFLQGSKWVVDYYAYNNNGLLILKK